MFKTSMTSITLLVIREYRLARKLSQKYIAEFLGKQTSAYCKIENGNSSLSFSDFIKICQSLKVNPSDLLQEVSVYSLRLSSKGWLILDNLSTKDDEVLNLINSGRRLKLTMIFKND